MQETPAAFNVLQGQDAWVYPVENLAGFRWHTGASLRPLAPDEPCPVLFRDIGPAALGVFLRGQLRRLSGPLSPLIYMRTADYREPYTDYEQTGRLVILRPLQLRPWHSGVPHVYVARATNNAELSTVGFVPGNVTPADAVQIAGDVPNVQQWRKAMGGRSFDETVAESLSALNRFEKELANTEEIAAPLRSCLQSADRAQREQGLAVMLRIGLTETDLCAAWHHLPRERRGYIVESLRRVDTQSMRRIIP